MTLLSLLETHSLTKLITKKENNQIELKWHTLSSAFFSMKSPHLYRAQGRITRKSAIHENKRI